jgi:hypothetical protein
MKFRLPALLVASSLLCSLAALAQEQGYWRASSESAKQITGDVSLGTEKLIINMFYPTAISRVRALEPAEISAVFDADSNTGVTANLYRINIPAEKKFQHKNSLCGTENVTWMVAYVAPSSLQLAFFSGQKPPVFTFDEIANSADKCGTFTYVR